MHGNKLDLVDEVNCYIRRTDIDGKYNGLCVISHEETLMPENFEVLYFGEPIGKISIQYGKYTFMLPITRYLANKAINVFNKYKKGV